MAKVIPHGADSDPSYVLVAGMTDADGNTYYRKRQPARPIVNAPQGPGAAAAVAQTTTVTTDADRRVPRSDLS